MRTRWLVLLVALAIFGADVATAQLKGLKKVFKKAPTEEREERARVKVKALAEELYETDPEFREEVDDHYQLVLGEHLDLVYRINTSSPAEAVVIREDRFRRHGRNALYDNLMVQGYVNRLGQRLVPDDSTALFAFRLIANPVPSAKALATGTVYLSTGLIAILENEAQLAYVLAHEMAHVHLDHWREKSMVIFGTAEYLERHEKKRAWKFLAATTAGALVGSQIDGRQGALVGAGIGAATMALIRPRLNLVWDVAQENEADDLAFEVIQQATYDVNEVKTLYANLLEMTLRDDRAGLGFLGRKSRLTSRIAHADELIWKAIDSQTSGDPDAALLIDTRRYKELMAELRRDNGIQALYYDMFHMAAENLRQAVEIRSNDPTALYYYGKVLELVGRTEEDLAQAREYFRLAAANDFRDWNFGSHLHYAMTLMTESADAETVKQAGDKLQDYIDSYSNYQLKEYAIRQLPSHLDTLYDYMMMNGQARWAPDLPEVPDGYVFANWKHLPPPDR